MTQLRVDIAKSFEGARERVRTYAPTDENLSLVLQRWLKGPMRFVEPDPLITEARRTVIELADALTEIAERALAGEKRPSRTAKLHLITALSDMEATVYQHGRATAAAEEVGIGTAGQRF